jgi:predicted Zn-dependent protease
MRLAATAAALLVCAWFGLGVVQSVSADAAADSLTRHPDPNPEQAAEIERHLDRAGFLNPDEKVRLMRAQLAVQLGDYQRAQELLEAVVAEHPDDLEAWATLAFATAGRDPEVHARARAAIRRLSPPVR